MVITSFFRPEMKCMGQNCSQYNTKTTGQSVKQVDWISYFVNGKKKWKGEKWGVGKF